MAERVDGRSRIKDLFGRVFRVDFPQTGGFLEKRDGPSAKAEPVGGRQVKNYDENGVLESVLFVNEQGEPTGYLQRAGEPDHGKPKRYPSPDEVKEMLFPSGGDFMQRLTRESADRQTHPLNRKS